MTGKDTLFAVSTGRGRAGLAVIRMTGQQSSSALVLLTGSLTAARRMTIRRITDPASREILDEALVVWFPGPQTVTGEDVAEFHVHGSAAVIAGCLAALSRIPGCRMAEAGEFTKRAYANERLNLVEVEGLSDLLAAETDAQRRLAMRQFLGDASSVFENWRRELLSALAVIEASIDFNEEDDVQIAAGTLVHSRIDSLTKQLTEALMQSHSAGLVRSGLRLVIAGPPNAGKSSLMNYLAGRSAAIVSPVAGTTRDVIESRLQISGVPVILSDTAGLRMATDDQIEQIGMDKAKQELRDADILIWMIATDTAVEAASTYAPGHTADLHIFNKSDLLSQTLIQVRNDDAVFISLKTGAGLDGLNKKLKLLVEERFALAKDAIVVRERHRVAVSESIRLLNDARAMPLDSLELMAEKMREAARCLGQLTGQINIEDTLGQIFSEFCIGK